MSTPTGEQVMIQNALDGLMALNEMEQLSEGSVLHDEDDAMAFVIAAAGAMPPKAEAVFRVLTEYAYLTMTSGIPYTDGKWKPRAAMTPEEVSAYRKQIMEGI